MRGCGASVWLCVCMWCMGGGVCVEGRVWWGVFGEGVHEKTGDSANLKLFLLLFHAPSPPHTHTCLRAHTHTHRSHTRTHIHRSHTHAHTLTHHTHVSLLASVSEILMEAECVRSTCLDPKENHVLKVSPTQ